MPSSGSSNLVIDTLTRRDIGRCMDLAGRVGWPKTHHLDGAAISTKALPDDLVTFEFTDVSNGSKVTAVVDVQDATTDVTSVLQRPR